MKFKLSKSKIIKFKPVFYFDNLYANGLTDKWFQLLETFCQFVTFWKMKLS